MLFRANKTNLYWQEIDGEKVEYLREGLDFLDKCEFKVKSFTLDGRRGFINYLRKRYPNIPIQLCQFHQTMIITRYNTNNPKTPCGKDLKALIKTLTISDREEFTNAFNKLKIKYAAFLKERNEHGQFKHKRLRSAFRSIKTNLPYLFTYKDCPELNIPNTTNTCDGYFAHLKQKIKIHRGLKHHRRKKMIYFYLENL